MALKINTLQLTSKKICKGVGVFAGTILYQFKANQINDT